MAAVVKTPQEIQFDKFKVFIKTAVTRGAYAFSVSKYELLANGSYLAVGKVDVPTEANPKKTESIDVYWRVDGQSMRRLPSQGANDGFNLLDLIQILPA